MQLAPQVICKLQRQQTRLLADYLQVLLNFITRSPAPLAESQLAILTLTCEALSTISQPILSSQTGADNQVALASFHLQFMLKSTLKEPLKQSQEFHRCPDFNFDQSRRSQSSLLEATAVVQHTMQWLTTAGITSTASLDQMLHHLQHPSDTSKLPEPDDAQFLEPADLLV